ncbi:hypothetical protein FH5_00138 [Priestia endophytica]|nr:hypothetical protein FH5_00138 [Priestia endophytica]
MERHIDEEKNDVSPIGFYLGMAIIFLGIFLNLIFVLSPFLWS